MLRYWLKRLLWHICDFFFLLQNKKKMTQTCSKSGDSIIFAPGCSFLFNPLFFLVGIRHFVPLLWPNTFSVSCSSTSVFLIAPVLISLYPVKGLLLAQAHSGPLPFYSSIQEGSGWLIGCLRTHIQITTKTPKKIKCFIFLIGLLIHHCDDGLCRGILSHLWWLWHQCAAPPNGGYTVKTRVDVEGVFFSFYYNKLLHILHKRILPSLWAQCIRKPLVQHKCIKFKHVSGESHHRHQSRGVMG